jgi:hypothetical protein
VRHDAVNRDWLSVDRVLNPHMWGITATPDGSNSAYTSSSRASSGAVGVYTSAAAPAHGSTTATAANGDSSSGYDSRTAEDDAVWQLDERNSDTANIALRGDAYSTLRARYAAGLLSTLHRKQWQCTHSRQACLALVRSDCLHDDIIKLLPNCTLSCERLL